MYFLLSVCYCQKSWPINVSFQSFPVWLLVFDTPLSLSTSYIPLCLGVLAHCLNFCGAVLHGSKHSIFRNTDFIGSFLLLKQAR